MNLYRKIVEPIEHLGAGDLVTVTDLRRCLANVAKAIGKLHPIESEAAPDEEISGSAIGDDGPAPTGASDPARFGGKPATVTGQDEADTE